MSKHETERRVPNLRFKGFTDDWMQQKLSTLVELLRSYPLSRKYETLTKSGTRYVHYGDIHTGVVNIINKENELPCILEEEYKTLKKGDIILADASEDYQGIAWPAVLNINPIEDIVAGLHTIALRPKNDVDSLFMYYTFLTTDFRKFGYRMGTGMKVFGITSNNLLKYDFKLPSKIDEQIKVRNIIGLINNIITLEQEKINKIKNIKIYLIQTLFAHDKNFPFLRFQSYFSSWNVKKLSEIASIRGGGTPSTRSSEYWNGTINWFTPSEVGDSIYLYESKRKISQRGLRKSSATLLPKNKTILFTSRAGIGDTAILKENSATNQGFQSLILDENTDVYFLFSMSEIIKREAIRRASGSTFLEVSATELGKITLSMPDIKEQKRIGNLLHNIDNLINLKQKTLKNYKQVKEVLLNNLFI